MTLLQDTVKNLQHLRSELMHRADAINADVHHREEPVEKDFAEQVTQRENDDVLTALNSETRQTIRLIDAALLRIKQGNYGICSVCGGKIPDKRIQALPYVTTCINCSE